MRPIGGWLLGWYADRHGRKAALLLSVWLMCFGSLAIACTPGYATIGVAAPILLVISRLVQGLSLGGEYGPSATYLSEMATRAHRGFYRSEERRVGKEWVSQCRSRGSPSHSKKKIYEYIAS